MHIESSVIDYFRLSKMRIMLLVVFTAFCGLMLANGKINALIGLTTIISIAMGSAASASLNMWYDRDIDSLMSRTKKRPIVVGVIKDDEALAFGIIMGIMSITLMAVCVNFLSAFLLLFAILYYVIIYTIILKRRSIYNVVLGGISGAMPPIIGYSAVSSDISLYSCSLFLIIFTWTPPHSWALALFRSSEYKICNIPMMPIIKGKLYTKKQILFYTILMIISSFIPYYLGMSGVIYLVIALTINCVFLYYVILLFNDINNKYAKKLFIFSIFYLFIIFLALLEIPILGILL